MKDSGYLVFDWRKGEIRDYHKTKKAEIGAHEKRVPVSVEAETPEIDVEAAAGEINVTEGDIRAALGDNLVEEPEERIDRETSPQEVVFKIDVYEHREQIDDLVDIIEEDGVTEDDIDYWRNLISTEHREMNRPKVLEYMEEKLDELKAERDA